MKLPIVYAVKEAAYSRHASKIHDIPIEQFFSIFLRIIRIFFFRKMVIKPSEKYCTKRKWRELPLFSSNFQQLCLSMTQLLLNTSWNFRPFRHNQDWNNITSSGPSCNVDLVPPLGGQPNLCFGFVPRPVLARRDFSPLFESASFNVMRIRRVFVEAKTERISNSWMHFVNNNGNLIYYYSFLILSQSTWSDLPSKTYGTWILIMQYNIRLGPLVLITLLHGIVSWPAVCSYTQNILELPNRIKPNWKRIVVRRTQFQISISSRDV